MDASTILEKFFESRADVDEIINPNQLRKWFPKSTSSTSLQILYEILHEDRKIILQRVSENIKSEFKIPLSIDGTSINPNNNDASTALTEKYNMSSFLEHLKDIERVSLTQHKVLDEKIDAYSRDIEKLLSLINDVGDKLDRDDGLSASSSLGAVNTLEAIIDGGK
ncbi:hypothetical protein CANTEDRAFT_113324 [Yamadazyma tenuis ATCC 10573]|uniref:Uncharacterized protein n=1 Tax=Candida tenuis (strain ATCC 10573 / BCRC 21748 / CBS 615 / JCM 9827 / NBRC 10315 / NRRL Y-1498 / VKM Y-70) TaxID=590646 RepID=G3B1X8_CANTC|nr:uncharacterized protein CANTEDRAFT_113324 [Yamadazyma tenuis ATCC 10573]EGV64557.1 hypothetical protein CANTEDRAFT_113324 [Yamadazyma tenuis ATCC 10573]